MNYENTHPNQPVYKESSKIEFFVDKNIHIVSICINKGD